MTQPTPPSATRTIAAQPRRITPVALALIIGATTNLIALATFTTIVLDGPLWLVVTLTVATVALAAAARQTLRAIPDPRSTTAQSAHDVARDTEDGVE